MPELTPALFAASTVQVIGIVIAILAVLTVVVYAAFNVRAGRQEVGSELELAANLKPYYDDDELETKKLDRALTAGLAGLVLVGVGLPAYWLAEPGRQEGAVEQFESVFVSRGEELYTEGAQCNACHGPEGVGGVASHTILDEDNEFVAQVNWLAPALDNVLLRYDEEEVYYVLEYGRPFSPMPAWGAGGGGPLTEQQLENIIAYLRSIQISHEESVEQVENELRTVLELGEDEDIDYTDLAVGEALFNLGQETAFSGGAYACGRCHTRGWSIDADSAAPADADLDLYVDYPDGSGAFGPRIQGVVPRQFATIDALAEFLVVGAERGVPYGLNGLSGDGQMPGFADNPNTEDPEDGMLTVDMVQAIARYVESLEGEQ
ncbi:MAG: c-type cytochrome [Acidimicrobiia bacterium]